MKSKKVIIGLLVLLLLIALTVYFVFRGNELGELFRTMKEANPLYLAAGLLLMFLFVVSEGFGIQILLSSLGYKTGALKCIKYSFLGFYYCSITPAASGGQPAQIYYMKNDGITIGDSSLCIMTVTVSYHIGMLLLCLFFLITRSRFLAENLGAMKYLSMFGAVANFVVLSVFIASAFSIGFLTKFIRFITKALNKIKVVKNPDKTSNDIIIQLEKYGQGAIMFLKKPRVLLLTLVFIIVQILSRLSVAIVVFKSFGLHGYGVMDILSLQAFLALSVESLPLPGSVGAAEAGFYTVNKNLFGQQNVVTATLLTRGISFYAFLIISGAVSLYVYIASVCRKAAAVRGNLKQL